MDREFLNKKIDSEEEKKSSTRQFSKEEFQAELVKEELSSKEPSFETQGIKLSSNIPTSQEKLSSPSTEEKESPLEDTLSTREIRRQYWQEKQVKEDLENRPFHRYPDYFYGGLWLRLFAYIVDLIVIQSIGRIAVNNMFTAFNLPKDTASFSYYTLAHLAVYLLYFILMTKFTNGQTVGKMIFGLRVVCFKEQNLSWSTVLVREGFCRYFLNLSVLRALYLVLLFTPQKQHVGDLLSDTSVVSENLLKASQLDPV
ncbi:RDD family protein [Carnobacterium sp.]|uniref:RDD family protein n=1 Tax=Carnobacterium TaxID=2747 RepID=UPI002FCA489C